RHLHPEEDTGTQGNKIPGHRAGGGADPAEEILRVRLQRIIIHSLQRKVGFGIIKDILQLGNHGGEPACSDHFYRYTQFLPYPVGQSSYHTFITEVDPGLYGMYGVLTDS